VLMKWAMRSLGVVVDLGEVRDGERSQRGRGKGAGGGGNNILEILRGFIYSRCR